ncbi:MAG: type II toxin-antitoxin system HicA family toxin [Candidatus Coatesbacteria bacterium]
MAAYTYDQVRRALRRLEFRLIRSRKHETWERIAPNGAILQVRLSHKGNRPVPPGTFGEILRQAGITREQFLELI